MKIIAKPETSLKDILESNATKVDGKFFYIPGWWELTKRGNYVYHHFNNLPDELTKTIETMRNEDFHKIKKEK